MLSSIEKEACVNLIESCFSFHNRNGRLISTPFEELPDESNTIYYEKVSQPKSFASVLNLLNQDHYDNLKDLYTDLKQVFSNLSYIVAKSGRDWQDAIRMDQYVDETWEQKAAEKLLPSLEVLFPDSSHPRLEPTSRRPNPNEVSDSQPTSKSSTKPTSILAAPLKRSRSQSTSSSASADGTQTPITSSHVSTTATRNQTKRSRKSLTTPVNNTPDDDGPTTAKDRVPDPESGWMRDGNSHLNSQALATFIITRLKNERLPAGSFSSHSIPHQSALSDTTIAQDSPALKLDLIEAQLQKKQYPSMEAFDRDLHQAFVDAEKAYSNNDPDRLAGLFVLKRLYQELTQGDGTQTLRDSIPVGAAKKLASVTMGPGNRLYLPRNDEPVKLRAKDKILLEGIHHKGDYIRIGDWVHIFNPDDPSRPIIGQIFNTYRRVDTGRRTVNVCWYYRPEETVHYISRTFLANEVFKTGNFIDHVVEDILGRCLVLFYTKYVRGRPSAPLWTPDTPTYICEHRYKDDQYSFKKIKNWDSCVPSNIRNEGTEENFQTYPTIQQVSTLVRLPSPFLSPPSDRSKGSGEPIIATPQEVTKELPKDQTKCHDLNMSLLQIEKVLGRLPTNPPRRPHGIEPGEESAQSTRSPSVLPKPLTLPQASSSAATAAIQSTASPNLSFQPPAGKPFDLTSLELCHLVGHSQSGPVKRPPCLLDLVASQDCFEKLPEKLFDSGEPNQDRSSIASDQQSEEQGDDTNNHLQSGEGGGREDLIWFPCLPASFLTSKNHHQHHHHNRAIQNGIKKNDQHRDPSLSTSKSVHSEAYLDWLSKK